MKYYAGLDVSLNSTALCIVNQDGDIIHESEVPSEPGAIAGWLKDRGLPMEGSVAKNGKQAFWFFRNGGFLPFVEGRFWLKSIFATEPICRSLPSFIRSIAIS